MSWLAWISWTSGLWTASCAQKNAPPEADPARQREEQKEAAHQDEPGAHDKSPRRVRVSAQVMAEAGIKTAPVAARSLPMTVDVTGQVMADPDRSARITARVPGRVAEVLFKDGDRVQAGTVLVILESTELSRTRAELRSSGARAQAAQENARRIEALSRAGLAAGQELAVARAEAAARSAEVALAQRTLVTAGAQGDDPGVARLEVRAPISGVILLRDAVRGQTVGADHVLAELADLEVAYFVGRLFEKNIARVHVGERAEVRLNAYPGAVFVGEVERVGKQLDLSARTVVARIAIKNREDLLKVGLFGKARVTTATSIPQPPQLVVPLSAVTQLDEQDVVFVRQPDDHFEVHPLKLGRSADGFVEVLGGLRAGEAVVTEGVFSLKSLALKSTFGEED